MGGCRGVGENDEEDGDDEEGDDGRHEAFVEAWDTLKSVHPHEHLEIRINNRPRMRLRTTLRIELETLGIIVRPKPHQHARKRDSDTNDNEESYEEDDNREEAERKNNRVLSIKSADVYDNPIRRAAKLGGVTSASHIAVFHWPELARVSDGVATEALIAKLNPGAGEASAAACYGTLANGHSASQVDAPFERADVRIVGVAPR